MLRRCVSGVRFLHCETSKISVSVENPSNKQVWDKRLKLRDPKLQTEETLSPKVYFAPDWDLTTKANGDEGQPDPLRGYGMTPEKWEYHNKIVWPPGYVVPETGLQKRKEVFHKRESVHFSPKRMWQACQLVWKMNVEEAITQLELQQMKGPKILADVLREAKDRATDEFHIEFPGDMYVADAFPIQSQIIKGARRHAHENWCTIRYRYINIFVRLEEGPAPQFKTKKATVDGWGHMSSYYDYLRGRDKKMVNVVKGVLVTCDAAMRQLLIHLDESRQLGSKFIIKELNETHLFIDKDIIPTLEEKLDQIMEAMNPELGDK